MKTLTISIREFDGEKFHNVEYQFPEHQYAYHKNFGPVVMEVIAELEEKVNKLKLNDHQRTTS